MHLTLAVITDLCADPNEGIFADVTYLPNGPDETVQVGGPYTGGGFGFWLPLKIDDTVLLAVPHGDPNHGPVVIARLWSSGDPPPAEIVGDDDVASGTKNPTNDVWLRVEDARAFKLKTSGGGEINLTADNAGNITIAQIGSAKVVIQAGDVVQLQDGTQPFVRGTDYADALGNFLSQFSIMAAAIGAYATAAGIAVPALAPAGLTLNAALTIFSGAITTYRNARSVYLSSKVTGQ